MPLANFDSICQRNAAQIVSKDKGNTQCHRAINANREYVTHYQIDGTVIRTGERCDFLLMNEVKKKAYLIELKGSDLVKAARQIEATVTVLHRELVGYDLLYRIVSNKCKTHAIQSSAYRRFQIRWKEKLMQKTGCIEENI